MFSGYFIALRAVSGCPTRKLRVFAIHEPSSTTWLGGLLKLTPPWLVAELSNSTLLSVVLHPKRVGKIRNKKEKILDLGSGGGFPGILLAILKPECEIHLLEKSQKKCYFLNKTKDSLNLTNMRVLKTTIQKSSPIGEYSLITARAFSSAKNILEISEKNLMKEGKYLLLKGKIDKINEELESINTNKYKCEIIKTENEKYERHLVEIKINE